MRLADFGPLYKETVLGRFPVEPWNTYSNIFFLLLVIYWARRTRFDHCRHPLIITILPILLIGFVGGTIFHATRSNRIWLFMDFMPILICSLLAAVDFWRRVLGSMTKGVLLVLLCFAVLRLFIHSLDLDLRLKITLGYSSLAISLLLPAVIHCVKNYWQNFVLLLGASCSFCIALFFRFIDQGLGAQLFPMGTHFLWHIFGALSVLFLTEYIYRDDIRV